MRRPEVVWVHYDHFPISHFCEKARWALDHHGVPCMACHGEGTPGFRVSTSPPCDAVGARVIAHPYLVGEQFSRADLTAAALFSALSEPAERPYQSPVRFPDELLELQREFRDRPAWAWVERLYREHRGQPATR